MSTVRDAIPIRTALLAGATLLAAVAPAGLPALRFQREAVLHGELWRLLSAHVAHLDGSHLLWDVLALVAIGILFEKQLGASYWRVLLAAVVAVDAGLLLSAPNLADYCGLSGVLSGMWAGGALVASRNEHRAGRPALGRLYLLLLGADLLKIAWETATDHPLFANLTAANAAPVPLSHLCGALAGILAVAQPGFLSRRPAWASSLS